MNHACSVLKHPASQRASQSISPCPIQSIYQSRQKKISPRACQTTFLICVHVSRVGVWPITVIQISLHPSSPSRSFPQQRRLRAPSIASLLTPIIRCCLPDPLRVLAGCPLPYPGDRSPISQQQPRALFLPNKTQRRHHRRPRGLSTARFVIDRPSTAIA